MKKIILLVLLSSCATGKRMAQGFAEGYGASMKNQRPVAQQCMTSFYGSFATTSCN